MSRSVRAVVGVVLAGAAAAVAARAGSHVRRRRAAMAPVAPELRSPLLYLPFHVTSARLVRMSRRLPVPPARPTGAAQVEHVVVPGAAGQPDVEVYLYRPSARPIPSGALVWIHGGGYVIGHPATYHALCSRLAAESGILVASVDY